MSRQSVRTVFAPEPDSYLSAAHVAGRVSGQYSAWLRPSMAQPRAVSTTLFGPAAFVPTSMDLLPCAPWLPWLHRRHINTP